MCSNENVIIYYSNWLENMFFKHFLVDFYRLCHFGQMHWGVFQRSISSCTCFLVFCFVLYVVFSTWITETLDEMQFKWNRKHKRNQTQLAKSAVDNPGIASGDVLFVNESTLWNDSFRWRLSAWMAHGSHSEPNSACYDCKWQSQCRLG